MTTIDLATRPWTPWRAILLGGLTVGILDILDAFIFFGLRGVSAERILQAIAAGLIGRDAAVAGGVEIALLGLLLHFVIATGVVATYYLVSRVLPVLIRHPIISGLLYGSVVFFVMQLVVLPLSATAGSGKLIPSGVVLINGLMIHALGVGLPAALFTARGRTGNWLGRD
jgi:hypothetical protein